MSVVLRPSIVTCPVLLLDRRQPQHVGKAVADVIEQLHRNALAAAKLLDQRDALLELLALRLELLDLRQQRLQPRGFLLRRRRSPRRAAPTPG